MLQRCAHHALELAEIGFDLVLACGRAGIAFALLVFNPELLRSLLLEPFKCAGQCTDLVTAIDVAAIDREVAGGELQHGVAYVMQRLDHATGYSRYGDKGKGDSGR